MLLCLAACETIQPPCEPRPKGNPVYVVGQGWHAEIGIPVEQLGPHLSAFRKTFSGAKVLMFGYGKKTFFTAPADDISEYILGPVPGPAAIHVVGLSVTPLEAYPEGSTVVLRTTREGSRALAEYVWSDLAKDDAGKLVFLSRSSDPDGLFYGAVSEYNLFHTCNTWTADALEKAGLPVSGDSVVFSGQVMDQVEEAAEAQCKAN
ncbi:MAG TPA: DUF2459 domain-containing protein [Alphaproteobacteria bacterium]|nr:DUF2459 domain-containing protein [Alphaproteobacteria bacterium]